jgi:hypothetical protein
MLLETLDIAHWQLQLDFVEEVSQLPNPPSHLGSLAQQCAQFIAWLNYHHPQDLRLPILNTIQGLCAQP